LNKHTKKRKILFNIDWVGFNIVDKYVIGYGMDYNNLFRYLKDIYIKDE
jgi:hypoxanthine-guanine phosphoribosyltransferase